MNNKPHGFQADIYSIALKTFNGVSGNLSILESSRDIPFDIRRIYYIWNTQTGLPRGMHAHKELMQAFIVINGSCDLIFDNGITREVYMVNDPSQCLIVPPGYWRELKNFSTDCVLLVLASDYYNESDYIRDYPEYLEYVASKK